MISTDNEHYKSVTDFIANAGLTTDMQNSEIEDLVRIAEKKTFPRGTLILQEDSKSRDLYVIMKGRVSVLLSLPSECNREEIVYKMRDGQIFGELSLVDGSPRSASIQAEDDVVTYKFGFVELSKLLDEKPRIGYLLMRNIASIIATRMRNTNMLWRNSLIW